MAGPRNPKFLIGEIDGIEEETNLEYEPQAEDIAFDNVTSGLAATEVQSAIDELTTTTSASASPGFTWGSSGNISAITYLKNDSVPSNKAGRISTVSGDIVAIFAVNEIVNTFDIEIAKRIGAAFTVITTLTVTASRNGIFLPVSAPVAVGDELVCRISSGSAKNVVVGIVLKGSV